MRNPLLLPLAIMAPSPVAPTTPGSDFSATEATLAARQLVTLGQTSVISTTITSTCTDENGLPKTRTVWAGIITKPGASLSKSYFPELDVTTITIALTTRTYDLVTTLPTLYSELPTTLPKGTYTIRLPSTTTSYSVTESTVMNGPLYSETIYSTQTATISKGTGFTTRTATLSRPVVETKSIAVATSSVDYTTTVIGTVETGRPTPGSSTPTTLTTQIASPQGSPTASLSRTPSSPAPSTGSSPKSYKTVTIATVSCLVVAIVLISLGVWYWHRRKAAKKAQAAAARPRIELVSNEKPGFGPDLGIKERRGTVVSGQPSSDLPAGPYYNGNSGGQGNASSQQSYQGFRPGLRPPRPTRPETISSSVLGYMKDSNNSEYDFRIFTAEARRKDRADEERRMREERERELQRGVDLFDDERMEELESERRMMSSDNLAMHEREEARLRQEELERSARKVNDYLVPPPLNIVKKQQDRLGVPDDNVSESYYGSIAADGLNEIHDRRPYVESKYEDIPVDPSSSDEALARMPSTRKAPTEPSRSEILATTANLSSDHRRFEYVSDPDESDEEKKERERKVAERFLLYGDTTESIYSAGNVSLGWRAYNEGMNLNRSPRPDEWQPDRRQSDERHPNERHSDERRPVDRRPQR